MVAPLHADGRPWAQAAERDGIAIRRAEGAKATTYRELVQSTVVRLVTVACETGGRWSAEARTVLRGLAAARARSSPPVTQHAARASWLRRWGSLLSVAQQDALAATLVDDVPSDLDGADGVQPSDEAVWLAGLSR